jgi:hypothetical protein
MRTIKIKVYKFEELNEKAQEKAICSYHQQDLDYSYYYDEVAESAKAVANLFNLKFGREYTDLRWSHIDDDILELKGVRLLKYILNNYADSLFTPTFVGYINNKPYYSKTNKDNSCTLTKVCYDNDILQPVYDFLKNPDKHTTFEILIGEIESAISSTYNQVEDWINSKEFIQEEITANEYEFTAQGKIF